MKRDLLIYNLLSLGLLAALMTISLLAFGWAAPLFVLLAFIMGMHWEQSLELERETEARRKENE